jgi:hypothetical protein
LSAAGGLPKAAAGASRARAVIPALLAVVAAVVATLWFFGRWRGEFAGARDVDVAWGWALLGGTFLAMHALSSVLLWRQVVSMTGATFALRDAVDTFTPTLLARYLPGKVWANGFRLLLARRAGVALGATTGATGWEAMLILFTAGFVGLLGSRGEGAPAARYAALTLIGLTIGIWIALALLSRWHRGGALLSRLGGVPSLRSPAPLAKAVAIAAAGWCLYGAAHLAFARAVAPVAVTDWPLLSSAVALAWAGGFIAFVMPVGLGVRDGIQVTLLTPLLGVAPSLAFVAVSRIAQLTTDAVLTAVWALGRSRWGSRSPR